MTDEQKEKAKAQLLLFRNKFGNGNPTTQQRVGTGKNMRVYLTSAK